MKKNISILLSLVIIFIYTPFILTFATEHTELENNTEFAQKTAEIIKNDDSMLRIIGRFSKAPSDDSFSLSNESVISDDGRFVLQFSVEKDLLACLDKLNNNPDIIYAERDRPIYTEALEESAEYLSWGVKAIEADIYSQAITLSDNSVTVAIIDSGCEDIGFIKDRLVQGYDFADNDSDAMQDDSSDSHGTFLASVITDCTPNLPVNIMPVRILSSKTGSLINAVNGIIYAVDNGADVINLSLVAALNNCRSLEDAVKYAEDNNVTVIVCAGNNKSDIKDFCPAHIENVLTVSSVNSNCIFSESFSNFGDGIDLAAPGENIIGYNAAGEKTVLSGTSVSTAFVAAAAALYRLDHPAYNNNQVRDALISCAKDYGEPGRDAHYGFGIPKLGSLIKSPEIKIRNNPGLKTIDYGETLRLKAEITNRPTDSVVWWYVDGTNLGEGEVFEVSPSTEKANITAKLVGADGLPVVNPYGVEISDSETVEVNSGFFQKIISFFKNLFRMNRTVVQFIIEN